MPAMKRIEGSKEYENIGKGKYQIGYRKNNGSWEVIPELEFTIPVNRKASRLLFTIYGEEVDV